MIRTSLSQVESALLQLRLPKNHVYLIHSSLLRFGLIEGGAKGLVECFFNTLGQGSTILMPAYTFKFGKNRNWDFYTSKSEVGALTEYFRVDPRSSRTIHPFHSLSVQGKLLNEFIECKCLSSFGLGSAYQLLYQLNGINIGFGTDFIGGGTVLHHTEEMAAVPYRSYKEFPGVVIDKDGKELNETFNMYARIEDAGAQYYNIWGHVWEDFVRENVISSTSRIFSFEIKIAHDSLLSKLQNDPFYCAKKLTPENWK